MKKQVFKSIVITIWVAIACFPNVLNAQDTTKQIKRINRTLFEFKQEFLETKENFLKKEQTWKLQQEKFELLIKKLNSESEAARKEAIKLRAQVDKFEEMIENSETKKLGGDVVDIALFLDLLIYKEIGELQFTDTLLLKLINRHDSAISKDLLLFYLARYKHSIGESEFALGYYGNILTDYQESRLISKTIFEMGQIFGETGKDQEQKTLLLQLANQENPDKYGKLAIKKLQSLGVEIPKHQKQDVSMEDFPTESKPEKTENKDELNLDSLDFSFDE